MVLKFKMICFCNFVSSEGSIISAGTKFHITADLTMNELLESDFSTTGTLKLPWAALLVLVGLRLVSIQYIQYIHRALASLNYPYLQSCVEENQLLYYYYLLTVHSLIESNGGKVIFL